SAGYMAALATDRIFARRSAITGSIGVLFQFAQVEDLMQTIGVDIETVRSGKLKAQPSPFEPASEESRQLLQELVADSFDWFVGLVVERRGLSADAVRSGEGRIYTGGQALDAGLIDAIGGEKEAKAWLVEEKDIDDDLPIKTWKPKPIYDGLSFAEIAGGWILSLLGLDTRFSLGAKMADRIVDERLLLDGLVSVWHASSTPVEFSEKGGRQ
ncbi:MAG: S49 family peptidase, partial [Hyphomicrobiales bacterium]|nr:S49 family peptidase [Hyphomicrobiales bacterium]